jgi:flagellar biogenesis protein FliO
MDIVRPSCAAALLFALLSGALWFLRKRGWAQIRRANPKPGLLESRGKLALTPRHSVHLIRIGDRNLVLGLHPDGFTFLGDAVPAGNCDGKQKAAL